VKAATKSSIADSLADGKFKAVLDTLGNAGIVATGSSRFQTNGDLYDDETMDKYEQDRRRF